MSDDIVYYNLTIGTDNSALNNQSLASISAQNSQSIIDNPKDYYGSIVRLSIPQFEIPNFYFDVETDANGNVPDINTGVYKFTVGWGTISTTGVINLIASNSQNVRWVQQDFTAPVPKVGVPPTQSSYYFGYSYEEVIDQWNTAISNAYSVVQAAVGSPLIANKPPFFVYDATTQLISLYSPQVWSEFSTSGNFLQIYFNDITEPLMTGFTYNAYLNPTKTDLFYVKSYPNSSTPTNNVTINGTNYIKITQQYNGLAYWNMLRNIFITTSMPVTQEGYFEGSNQNKLGQNILLQSTLTDYIPDLSQSNQAGVAGSQFIYNAPSLWRLFCFNNSNPLYNISASIYFTDKNNNIWPLTLFTGQAISIKFMFIKKHLISNLLKDKV
jgi:hypothetical protein